MMKYPDSLPSSDHFRRRERGFTLHELLVVIMIVALALAIGVPMTRRALVRSRLMGQVKMLQNAVAVSRMRAITEGRQVVIELLEKQDGVPHETPPLGLIRAWVDNSENLKYNAGSDTIVGDWYLNIHTAILKEGGSNRLHDLKQGRKGVVFFPTGIADATKSSGPGVGRGSVIIEDAFGNRIRMRIWSSAATVQLWMWDPGIDDWSEELRHWQY